MQIYPRENWHGAARASNEEAVLFRVIPDARVSRFSRRLVRLLGPETMKKIKREEENQTALQRCFPSRALLQTLPNAWR